MSDSAQLYQDLPMPAETAVAAELTRIIPEDASAVSKFTGHVRRGKTTEGSMRAVRGAEDPAGTGNGGESVAADCRLSDEDLAEAAHQVIDQIPVIRPGKVKARARNGWLILEGEVDAPHHRRAIETAVKTLRHTNGVSNNIQVASDALAMRVHRKIIDAIVQNARLDAGRIVVSANDRTIILSGWVRTVVERAEAEAAACLVPGTAKVVNRIRIMGA